MNKQELIKHFEEMEYVSVSQMGKKAFIDLIEQLDEPQKPVVPQFVADWIESSKQEKRNIRNTLNNGGEKMRLWFLDLENYDTFVRAWLDGYTVEEKRYLVKMKGLDSDEAFLKFQLDDEYWYMGIVGEYKHARGRHTRKELENAGFGDVFNCPLFEVDEVD
jgi:hypothetical protein